MPHTAILANNKKRIADQIGEFVVTHFLNDEFLTKKLSESDLSAEVLRSDNPLGRLLVKSLPNWARACLNEYLRNKLLSITKAKRVAIGTTIAKEIEDWEDRSFCQTIEDAVGAELQFIRLNGDAYWRACWFGDSYGLEDALVNSNCRKYAEGQTADFRVFPL